MYTDIINDLSKKINNRKNNIAKYIVRFSIIVSICVIFDLSKHWWIANAILFGGGFLYNLISMYGLQYMLSGYKKKQMQYQYDTMHDRYDEFFKNVYENYYSHNEYNYNTYNGSSNKQTNTHNTDYNNSLKLMSLTDSSTDDEVKKSYKQLALKWHPDRWVSESAENIKIANRNFQKLNNAYSVIKKYRGIK